MHLISRNGRIRIPAISGRQISPAGSHPLELVHVDLPAGAEVPMPAQSYNFLSQLIWVIDGRTDLSGRSDLSSIAGGGLFAIRAAAGLLFQKHHGPDVPLSGCFEQALRAHGIGPLLFLRGCIRKPRGGYKMGGSIREEERCYRHYNGHAREEERRTELG